jgi:hypothetical protein
VITPRNSTIFSGGTAVLLLLVAGLLGQGHYAVEAAQPVLAAKGALVRELELTDLCLFTEASYTRHPAMADLTTAFQDSPLSFEHFPSGALVSPPPPLVANSTNGQGIIVRHHGR